MVGSDKERPKGRVGSGSDNARGSPILKCMTYCVQNVKGLPLALSEPEPTRPFGLSLSEPTNRHLPYLLIIMHVFSKQVTMKKKRKVCAKVRTLQKRFYINELAHVISLLFFFSITILLIKIVMHACYIIIILKNREILFFLLYNMY